MINAIVHTCPSCGARNGQNTKGNGDKVCAYCGTEYTPSIAGTAMGKVVAVKRAISRKEKDKDFGVAQFLWSLIVIGFFWGFFTFWSAIFIFVIGLFIVGSSMTPTVAITIGGIGTLVVGIIYLKAQK